MKGLFALLLLIFYTTIIAQNSFIEYSSIPRRIETKSDIEEVNKINEEANNTFLSFKLEFNQNQSFFSEINKVEEEYISAAKSINLIFLCYKPYYYFKDRNLFYFTNADVLVQKKEALLDWKITTESKKIDNYTCYKATYEEKFINRANKPSTKIITAWFCPELPYSYGPSRYNGLPGLILELEISGYKYVAKKINITKNNEPIDLPKLKMVTEEEYLEKILKNLPY